MLDYLGGSCQLAGQLIFGLSINSGCSGSCRSFSSRTSMPYLLVCSWTHHSLRRGRSGFFSAYLTHLFTLGLQTRINLLNFTSSLRLEVYTTSCLVIDSPISFKSMSAIVAAAVHRPKRRRRRRCTRLHWHLGYRSLINFSLPAVILALSFSILLVYR